MIAKRDNWSSMSDAEKIDYLYDQCAQAHEQLARGIERLQDRVRVLSQEAEGLRQRLDGEA